jgi:hypothetical protein
MRQSLRTLTKYFLYALILHTSLARAQQPTPTPATPKPAPVPTALLHAKKIFISNAGADSGLFPHPFTGDPDRAYNQFYSSIQALGRYEVVDNPSDAELIFELQLSAPSGPQNADKAKGASDPVPMFRLVIFDRPTHYVLWALTESIDAANLQKNHDRNFDEALDAITRDLTRLTSSTP